MLGLLRLLPGEPGNMSAGERDSYCGLTASRYQKSAFERIVMYMSAIYGCCEQGHSSSLRRVLMATRLKNRTLSSGGIRFETRPK